MNQKHRKLHEFLIKSFSIATFVLVPVTVFAIILSVFFVSAAKKEMAASVEREARTIAVQESRIFGGIRNTLIGISQFSEIKSGNRESCDKTFAVLLDHINNPTKQFLVIGIADINGDTICSVPPFTGKLNIADRDYFKRAVASRDFSFGNYQIGRVSNQQSVSFGYPIIDETGGVRYVVFISLDLRALNNLVQNTDMYGGNSLTMTDEDHNILMRYPTNPDFIGKVYKNKDVLEKYENNEGSAEVTDIDGISRIIGFSTIRTPNGVGYFHVIVGIPSSDLITNFLPNLSFFWITILAAFLMLMLVAGWYMGRKITSHLSEEGQIV